jgi:hypothetical protein
MSITRHTLPDGRQIALVHRDVMDRNRVAHAPFRMPEGLFEIPGAIDWTKAGTISLPTLGNNKFGDCVLAMACHVDQAMTANVGAEAQYDEPTVIEDYLRLSGGDNGLDEATIVRHWSADGLPGHPESKVLGSLDLDVTDAKLARSALWLFGHVCFFLSVPNRWLNSAAPGSVWDAPATPNRRNGHGVCWLGCDEQGRYDVSTWGMLLDLTPAGVACCEPSGFVVFTTRWFDPETGIAPNGLTYDQLAELWVQAGGHPLPPSPFPGILPPA